MSERIRILGIDPGLRRTGWGVVEARGSGLFWRGHGVVAPPVKLPLADRLGQIHAGVGQVLRESGADHVAVESLFVHRNSASALKLGQARGAALAALAGPGPTLEEFSPRQVKLSLTGTGAATKSQIAYMVSRLLPRAGNPGEDEADALAVAIAGIHYWQSGRILAVSA